MNEKDIVVFKYIRLKTKGIGYGLTKSEIEILNNIPDSEWADIVSVILELGGSME